MNFNQKTYVFYFKYICFFKTDSENNFFFSENDFFFSEKSFENPVFFFDVLKRFVQFFADTLLTHICFLQYIIN